MTTRYEVTTFDVCTPGFERLRSNSEFLLVGHVTHDTSKEDLISQFHDDLQVCERPEGFDFDAVRKIIDDYMAGVNMESALRYIPRPKTDEDGEPAGTDEDDESEGCSAYLYIHDNSDESNEENDE